MRSQFAAALRRAVVTLTPLLPVALVLVSYGKRW